MSLFTEPYTRKPVGQRLLLLLLLVLFQPFASPPFRAFTAQLFALIHLVKSSPVIASLAEMMLDACLDQNEFLSMNK